MHGGLSDNISSITVSRYYLYTVATVAYVLFGTVPLRLEHSLFNDEPSKLIVYGDSSFSLSHQ